MDDSSISTREDSDCSVAANEEDQQGLSSPPGDVAVPCNMQTAQPTEYFGNVGDSYYPMQGSPMQLQQQGILPWVSEGYSSAGAYQTPMQHAPQQHMSMYYDEHVDMLCPVPVAPMAQYQRTSGGAYLQNIGGTYYPVATQPVTNVCGYVQNYAGMCSTLTPSYTQPPAMGCGENIIGSCPFPAPSYTQPTQEYESRANLSNACTAPVAPPVEKYPRTMSYGGRTYPYWMSDLGYPLSTPS